MIREKTQPESDRGPLSARQRNTIRMAFRWQAGSAPIVHPGKFDRDYPILL